MPGIIIVCCCRSRLWLRLGSHVFRKGGLATSSLTCHVKQINQIFAKYSLHFVLYSHSFATRRENIYDFSFRKGKMFVCRNGCFFGVEGKPKRDFGKMERNNFVPLKKKVKRREEGIKVETSERQSAQQRGLTRLFVIRITEWRT